MSFDSQGHREVCYLLRTLANSIEDGYIYVEKMNIKKEQRAAEIPQCRSNVVTSFEIETIDTGWADTLVPGAALCNAAPPDPIISTPYGTGDELPTVEQYALLLDLALLKLDGKDTSPHDIQTVQDCLERRWFEELEDYSAFNGWVICPKIIWRKRLTTKGREALWAYERKQVMEKA